MKQCPNLVLASLAALVCEALAVPRAVMPVLAASNGAGVSSAATVESTPPVAPRHAHVDTLFGDVRSDDWSWLRDKSNPEVKLYLDAENAYADQIVAPLAPLRATLYDEMLARIKQTDLTVPYRQGDGFYYSRTQEGKQYPIHCRKQGSLDAPEQVILDVNQLAEGQKFMGIGAMAVSDDGNLLAFSTDSTGFRQYVLHVKDLRTGHILPERRERTNSAAWAGDDKTLFYVVEDDAKRPYRLYRHALGAASDDLVYEEEDEMFRIEVRRTRSRAFLVLEIASHTTSEARVLDATHPEARWRVVEPRRAGREYDLDHHDERFFIRVNDTGRNFRLVTAPVADPASRKWKEILPQRADVMLEGLDCFADHYAVYQRRGGLQEISVTDLRNGKSHLVNFPEPTYSVFASTNREWNTNKLRYSYQSLVTPSSIYDYDMEARTSTLLKQTEVLGGYDPKRYVSERIEATAKDGTRVPISLVYRRGLRRDGSAPMLLSGYGSYGMPLVVAFSPNRLSLLDRGFVVALAHIRGGGEMGKAWHDQGRMLHKMNTFTDFIACAEHLEREKYTSKECLVIEGGSAGGLLMGAVTNLRPDLFKAVVARVPFVDVINTMLDESLPLTVGEFEEWGNPRHEDEYRTILRYSPYDNLQAKAFPALLVKTSFNDSQVMYHEPAKYVAKLRTLKTDDHPLLLVTNMGAGHGGASGRYDKLREVAFDYAFVLWQVGLAEPAATSAR